MATHAESPSRGRRYWAAFWMCWGWTVGLPIAWLDGSLLAGMVWPCAGMTIAAMAWARWDLLWMQVDAWYQRFADQWDPPVVINESSPAFATHLDEWRDAVSQWTDVDDDERERLARDLARESRHSLVGSLLLVPPMLGLLWGVAIGPFIGILAKFDPRFEITAACGAIAGMLGMVVLLTLVTTLALFALVPFYPPQFTLRGRPHWLILLAPVLLFPLAVHCLRTGGLRWRRHAA